MRRILLAALLLLGCGLSLDASSEAKTQPNQAGRSSNVTSPEVVEVGVWPTVIYNLDVHSNTFYMTAYVWFIWKGDIDPSETAELVNNVESWGLTKVRTYPKPITFPDGRKYQCLRIEGRFFQPFSLKRFPLEHHTLTPVSYTHLTLPTKRIV